MTDTYDHIRAGGTGSYESKRGLIAVWGKEAEQFLNGMITNDAAALADGMQMLAAFPNAQGRLIAVVRVLRRGDKFLFETEDATRETVFENLFRFTFAGDFFVEDISAGYRFCDVWNFDSPSPESVLLFNRRGLTTWAVPNDEWTGFCRAITDREYVEISDDDYEILRIESGVPKYGVDMDGTTIVPEIGQEGMISYQKGCYIGQEIIARIHFRGHVAKMLTGLVLPKGSGAKPGAELTSRDGKSAGRITSVAYSPALDRDIALGYVRFEHLADGTELVLDGNSASVKDLPFI